MVNELNKPPSQENLALGERLLTSQRQLQEMQEEHRQLLQEMEVLRQRAAALSRLNEQQFGRVGEQRSGGSYTHTTNENATNNQTDVSEHAALDDVEQETTTTAGPIEPVEQTTNLDTSTNNTQTMNPASLPTATENDEDDEDPEIAKYLQEKLAEIAKLKARFKRVQNIMNTTDMIEQHINSKGVKNSIATKTVLESSMDKLHITESLSEVQSPYVTSTTTTQPNIKLNEDDAVVKIDPTKYENTSHVDEQTINAHAPLQTPNEELLSAMMNMFSDFTADLRSQAEDLRAERDRLRALKEDLLRRKRQS